MNFFEKIKQLADRQGLSLTEVSKRAGLGSRTIYNWKKKSPSINNLVNVAEVLNTSIDDLLGVKIKGKIDDFNRLNSISVENNKEKISQVLNVYPLKTDPLSSSLIKDPNQIVNDSIYNYQIRVPVIKNNLTGSNLFDEKNIVDYKDIVFKHKPDGLLFMLNVNSDAMSPTIPLNSVITVKHQLDTKDAQIVAIAVNKNVVIRRIKHINATPIAIADNMGHDPISLRNPNNIILGKVVHLDVNF